MTSRAHPVPNAEKLRLVRCKRKCLAVMTYDPRDVRHGTVTGYGYGCRCERCRAAKSISRFAKNARPGPYIVEVGGELFAFESRNDAETYAGMHKTGYKRCKFVKVNRRSG